MASSQQRQENVLGSTTSSSAPEIQPGEPSNLQHRFPSSQEENIAASPEPGSTPGNPIPGIRNSQEVLFEQGQITYHDEPEAPSLAVTSPTQISQLEQPTSSAAPASELTVAREGATDPDLPAPFPRPRSTPLPTTPGVHPGPADTSSVESSGGPFRFNPEAPAFEGGARALLRRGGHVQPEARDPMDLPNERPQGAPMADAVMVERLVRDAVYHMAMVYYRLMSADQDVQAEELADHFRSLFGEHYDDEAVRVIQAEPPVPPVPPEEGEEPEEPEDEPWDELYE